MHFISSASLLCHDENTFITSITLLISQHKSEFLSTSQHYSTLQVLRGIKIAKDWFLTAYFSLEGCNVRKEKSKKARILLHYYVSFNVYSKMIF